MADRKPVERANRVLVTTEKRVCVSSGVASDLLTALVF